MKIEMPATNEFASEIVEVKSTYEKACLLFGLLAFPWFVIECSFSVGKLIANGIFLCMKSVGII